MDVHLKAIQRWEVVRADLVLILTISLAQPITMDVACCVVKIGLCCRNSYNFWHRSLSIGGNVELAPHKHSVRRFRDTLHQ